MRLLRLRVGLRGRNFPSDFLSALSIRIVNTYRVIIEATFDVAADLKEFHAADGSVVGFVHPSGKLVRPCLGLEIQNQDDTFEYTTATWRMESLGLDSLDYTESVFIPEDADKANPELPIEDYSKF